MPKGYKMGIDYKGKKGKTKFCMLKQAYSELYKMRCNWLMDAIDDLFGTSTVSFSRSNYKATILSKVFTQVDT